MGYWDETRKCKMCGQEFTVYRSSRRETCSDACRKSWSRRKENALAHRDSIMIHLAGYRRMLKQYPDLKPELLEQLRFLKSEVNFLLLIGGDEEQKQKQTMLNDVAVKHDRAGL